MSDLDFELPFESLRELWPSFRAPFLLFADSSGSTPEPLGWLPDELMLVSPGSWLAGAEAGADAVLMLANRCPVTLQYCEPLSFSVL